MFWQGMYLSSLYNRFPFSVNTLLPFSGGIHRTWKPRYFILKDNCLFYFRNKGVSKVCGRHSYFFMKLQFLSYIFLHYSCRYFFSSMLGLIVSLWSAWLLRKVNFRVLRLFLLCLRHLLMISKPIRSNKEFMGAKMRG